MTEDPGERFLKSSSGGTTHPHPSFSIHPFERLCHPGLGRQKRIPPTAATRSNVDGPGWLGPVGLDRDLKAGVGGPKEND